MAQLLAFQFSAVGTQAWTAPEDIRIIGLQGQANRVLVTEDPNITASTYQAPASTSFQPIAAPLGLIGANLAEQIVSYDVSKGSTLYVSCAAAGTCFIRYLSKSDISS